MAITPPLPNAWITTPLATGPISGCTYGCTIGGLIPNSIYQYRAYMVVNGVPYYGEICTICTLPLTTTVPAVVTGNAVGVGCNNMCINDSCVTDCGNSVLTEYGVLYTQYPSYGTESTLIYGSPYVCMKSIASSIPLNVGYFCYNTCEITSLTQNTTTYFRAFAKNGVGSGYGSVCIQQTQGSTQQTVYLYNGDLITCSPTLVCGCAKIAVAPALTAGQSLRLNFTDTACSISPNSPTRNMFACAKVMCYSTTCNPSYSCLPDNIGVENWYCVDANGSYVDINCDTINSITLYAYGQSHASNAVLAYDNGASVCLTSITNQVGGSYILGDDASICLQVWNANESNGGESGGHLPSGLV